MKFVKDFFQDLLSKCDKYYFLTIILIAQNTLSRQYRDSVLGILWTLIQPMTQVVIYSLIMPHIMRFPVENYVTFLITSIFTWNFISQTLTITPNSLINNAEVIKRCIISKTIFPLSDVSRLFYNYIISFMCMYVLLLLLSITKFDPVVLLLPLYLVPIFIILAAASIALAFSAPYLKDLNEIMTVLVSVAFWLTPIVYPITIIPERLRYLFELNPFYIMIKPISMIAHQHAIPSFQDVLSLVLVAVLSCMLSYMVYRGRRKNFVFYL
jgi:lipopolysaccharide transport system permease protein